MAPVKTAEPKTIPTFPAADIEGCIRDYLADEGETQAVLHGSGSSNKGGSGGVGPQPVIDSLVVVGVLLAVEPMVPFELPNSLVRAGGYDSVEEVVGHLMPQLLQGWRKHQKEKD